MKPLTRERSLQIHRACTKEGESHPQYTLDPPTQLVEVQLTVAELQLISDISSRAAGSPTESRRGLTDSLGDKVRQAMRDNDVPFTQWETKDITSGLRFENR